MNNRCWRGYEEKGTLLHYGWECKLVQPPRGTAWRLLKKFKTTLWSSTATPKHMSRENHNPKGDMHPTAHSSTISQKPGHGSNINVNRQRNGQRRYGICIHGMWLSHKMQWNNAICSNMDEPRDYHSKWSKSDRGKYHVISLICGI